MIDFRHDMKHIRSAFIYENYLRKRRIIYYVVYKQLRRLQLISLSEYDSSIIKAHSVSKQ